MGVFVCNSCDDLIELLGDRREAPQCDCGAGMEPLEMGAPDLGPLRARVDGLIPKALASAHHQRQYRLARRALKSAEAAAGLQ